MDNSISIVHSTEVLGKSFQIYGTKDAPLFLAKDVAEWIEHSDTSTMLRNVDDDEKLTQTMFVSGQRRSCWYLTEHGLYEVLMQSRKPIAKEFKRQVKRILTEIRQTGSYGMEQKVDALLAMFTSTITTMQQSIVAMQQSLTLLQSAPRPALPNKSNTQIELQGAILRFLDECGGRATGSDIINYCQRPPVQTEKALQALLADKIIYRANYWTLSNGRTLYYCLTSFVDSEEKVDAPPVKTTQVKRPFTNSRIPCTLHNELSGELKQFPSMRSALRFLGVPTYGISYELAKTLKVNGWVFIDIQK
jgi:prophage antirepressor-like protein